MNKELKNIYKTLLAILTNLLHENDHLMGSDIPMDEYQAEAVMILARLDEADSPEELAIIMNEIFADRFDEGLAGPVSNYTIIARKLWKACEQHGMKYHSNA